MSDACRATPSTVASSDRDSYDARHREACRDAVSVGREVRGSVYEVENGSSKRPFSRLSDFPTSRTVVQFNGSLLEAFVLVA